MTFFNGAKAQVYLGGTFGLGYLNDNLAIELAPKIGYEFSDKWAAEFGAGVSYSSDYSEAVAMFEANARYNVWNNDRFFFDIKGGAYLAESDGYEYMHLGLEPSFRFKASDRVQFAANVGLFGIQYLGYEWTPAFGFNPSSTSLEIIYKF